MNLISDIKSRFDLRSVARLLRIDLPDRPGVKFSSPFRPDEHPSCELWRGSSGEELFVDRATGLRLDSIALLAHGRGISNADAVRELARELGPTSAPRPRLAAPTGPRKPAPPAARRVDLARLLADHAQGASLGDIECELWERSNPRPEAAAHDWHLLLGALFGPEDVLWIGDPTDSGREEHAARFRPRDAWRACWTRPGNRLAAGSFLAGSISRGRASVARSPFVVVESDELIGHKPQTDADREANKCASAALFHFLERVGLRLRAVIDTGGKSLHGWFDRPAEEVLSGLRARAEALRIDAGLLDRCAWSPLRLPGCIHEKTGRAARLLFLTT
ncbi:MAG: hypothetical protein JSR82_06635 [Verrucomicrobia bacterium]|nr:hypothetical protein [Verrucomicrobiota bacterium]